MARVAQCGTKSGYARHLRLDESACAPCLKAQRDYARSWAKKRRSEVGTASTKGRIPRSESELGMSDHQFHNRRTQYKYLSRSSEQCDLDFKRLRGGCKDCPVCGSTLPPSGFYRNKSMPDGRTKLCMPCHVQSREVKRRRGIREHWASMGLDLEMCIYCQVQPFQEFEHFEPISRGGSNSVENILPSCYDCNRGKASSDPWDWLAMAHPGRIDFFKRMMLD